MPTSKALMLGNEIRNGHRERIANEDVHVKLFFAREMPCAPRSFADKCHTWTELQNIWDITPRLLVSTMSPLCGN